MGPFIRAYNKLLAIMADIAGSILVLAVGAICLDVILRILGIGRGIPGVIEFTEYALYGITFLGAAWALRLGAHVSVEIVVETLPAPLRRSAWRLTNGIGCVVSLMLAYAGILAAWRSWTTMSLVFKTYIFPEWWLLVPLPFGAAILGIEFLRLMVIGYDKGRTHRTLPEKWRG